MIAISNESLIEAANRQAASLVPGHYWHNWKCEEGKLQRDMVVIRAGAIRTEFCFAGYVGTSDEVWLSCAAALRLGGTFEPFAEVAQ